MARAADLAPLNVVGYIFYISRPEPGAGVETATFDAQHTYFNSGDPREPYRYEKLSPGSFRITNFDPDRPGVEWSHLRFTLTQANRGTVFDEDDQLSKGEFQMAPPAAPVLSLVQRFSASVVVGVTGQTGQIVVIEQSSNLLAWSAVATNILWTGRSEISQPVVEAGRQFYRAKVPTQ